MNLNEQVYRIKKMMGFLTEQLSTDEKNPDQILRDDLYIKNEEELFELFNTYGFYKIENIDDLSNFVKNFDKSLYPEFEWFYFNPRTNAFFYKLKNNVDKKSYYFGFEKRFYQDKFEEEPRIEWSSNLPIEYWYKRELFLETKQIDNKVVSDLVRRLDRLKSIYYDSQKVMKIDENGVLYFYDHSGNKLEEISEKLIPFLQKGFNQFYNEAKNIYDKLNDKQKNKPIKSYKFSDNYSSLKDYFTTLENKGKELKFIV